MTLPLRRVLSVAGVLVLVLAVGVVAFLRTRDDAVRVSAVFPTTIGVYEGSDVRVLGVKVGTVDSITPTGTTVTVRMSLDPGTRVAADSSAVAIAPSLVSDRYVQLTPARRGAATIASGTTIPVSRTATPVELDQMYAALKDLGTALGPDGANRQGSLSRLLTTSARNLDGNGADLGQAVTELGKAAATLDGSQSDLFGTVSNLQGFNDTLVKNDQGVATLNDRLAQVSTTLAQDKADYAAAVQQLGQALALVETFVRDNRASIKGGVDGLQRTAATLAAQKAALEKISATVPTDLQNFLDAYDPSTGTLNSRGDLNEIGVWGQGAAAAAAPPTFLPSVTGATGGTR
ncbi:MCE family protein [Lapillicoccus jejuensis]|uniref:Virulence factor Mce-like protein n=1 Tax=Lapillicoccus jejuensis TaxID=402171 RepID=A0A542DWZ1_9MICO|nr:MCE family protein [Lapillicoccus jejuensis]TQJ07434.1 virulence factor Mce-like protein [Lapillicoccus jejuensis]